MQCHRCQKETNALIMSMFNTDVICMDCKRIEEEHPKYKEALEADHEQIVAGNYNFPGIGLPEDLKGN